MLEIANAVTLQHLTRAIFINNCSRFSSLTFSPLDQSFITFPLALCAPSAHSFVLCNILIFSKDCCLGLIFPPELSQELAKFLS